MKAETTSTRRHFIKVASVTTGFFLLGLNFTKKVYAETVEAVSDRLRSVYNQDAKMKFRKSQDNPEIKLIYKDFLEHPVSHKSHHLLHTKYTDRSGKIKTLASDGIKITLNESCPADS